MTKTEPPSGAQRVKDAPAPKRIRVLVSSQHALTRAGIRAVVEKIPEVEVVADGLDGRNDLELIKEHQPDIVLLEISIASMGAIESLKEIVVNFPRVRVIVITLQENEEYAVQAFRAGAAGYFPESAPISELEKAIKTVARGENYLPSEISKQAILKYLRDPKAFLNELTARQRQVLRMIAEGHGTKEIARRLNISVKTVETHRAQLMERLNIHDIAGLVRYALRMGLVKLDQ